ncbi:MAG: hypothetical protein L6R41_005383 [Letrouitia leprolyta]|nr:MAG: hypothetical protein L6R41_005383 [Letrouitia leprolyta]
MITLHPPSTLPHLQSSKALATEHVTPIYETTMDTLLKEVRELFEQQLRVEHLLALSKKLQAELKDRLQSSTSCMLPSHNYTLPDGKEHGTYLALEVGGSTLRVALVDLYGRDRPRQSLRIRRIVTSTIDNRVRDLRGLAFFDWIAEKIGEMLSADKAANDHIEWKEPLPMGIAWSFPIDQTSIRSGNIIGMGKGFHCSIYKGHDLGDLITQACQRLNLNIRLDAIVNDSSAAVLSRAYLDSSTRLAVILGTGINAAIHLPISSLHNSKFGVREFPTTEDTTHVLVNTELSMFGKKAFSATRWDEHLNAHHILPDYQPMEYLLAGGYLGEIVRLILVEATDSAGLFDGHLPPALSKPYSLETRTLATIEADTYPSLSPSCKLFQETYNLDFAPTPAEMHFIREVTLAVCRRSEGYFTAAIYALSSLYHEIDTACSTNGLEHISIGCDGSVINKYPCYMQQSQVLLDQMRRMGDPGRKRVVLESAGESAVLGAGVAAAMANVEK